MKLFYLLSMQTNHILEQKCVTVYCLGTFWTKHHGKLTSGPYEIFAGVKIGLNNKKSLSRRHTCTIKRNNNFHTRQDKTNRTWTFNHSRYIIIVSRPDFSVYANEPKRKHNTNSRLLCCLFYFLRQRNQTLDAHVFMCYLVISTLIIVQQTTTTIVNYIRI